MLWSNWQKGKVVMRQAFGSRSLTLAILIAFVLLVMSIDTDSSQEGLPGYFITCAAASFKNESISASLPRTADGDLDWERMQNLTVLNNNSDGKIISSQRAKIADDFSNYVEAYRI
jgi:hypothetical protein